jgi:hypothetical protein
MKNLKFIFPVIFLVSAILPVSACENYSESAEINGLIKKNGLSINMKAENDSNGFTLEKINESGGDYCLKIDVSKTCSLRGEAAVKPGNTYKLSFTLKNIDADPLINYSLWKKPKTSLRHYTFNGENGNPPTSETQKFYAEWITFEETFETLEGEDSFFLTLRSGAGTFYIRDINVEHLK